MKLTGNIKTKITIKNNMQIRDEKQSSIDMLQKAINRGFRGFADDINFLSWKVNPVFSSLSKDSRFIELQQQVNGIINREKIEAGITSS